MIVMRTNFFLRLFLVFNFIIGVSLAGCNVENNEKNSGMEKNVCLERARILLDSLYQNYSIPNSCLLRETFPFDKASEKILFDKRNSIPKDYSYLWPYSGTFSAVNALYEATRDKKLYRLLKEKVLSGLEEYYDIKREPHAYASYVTFVHQSDRYYDDNIWIGIEFTNLYMLTRDKEYLGKAKMIWSFILSGMDDTFDGGIYWCEQKKFSKNTCTNAPASVLAFKLFEATQDSTYFYQGKEMYSWTKEHLQDKTDCLYFDRINIDGSVGPAKHAYNSGQMMQSAAIQYKLTKDTVYLIDAQKIAKSCYDYFFRDYVTASGKQIRLLKKGDVWFSAVMLRGFAELYSLDKNDMYVTEFAKSLDYAWLHARDEYGLFGVDYSGECCDPKKWLLTQAAMVEMYARLAILNCNL